MKRTIAALWHNDMAEVDCMTSSNPMMDDLQNLLSKEEARLRTLLTGEAAAMFEKYIEFTSDYIRFSSDQAFASGFSLAVRLMTEALQDETY